MQETNTHEGETYRVLLLVFIGRPAARAPSPISSPLVDDTIGVEEELVMAVYCDCCVTHYIHIVCKYVC